MLCMTHCRNCFIDLIDCDPITLLTSILIVSFTCTSFYFNIDIKLIQRIIETQNDIISSYISAVCHRSACFVLHCSLFLALSLVN